MSTSGRAYDLLRAYVHTAYDRIFVESDPQESAAFDRELAETLPPVKPGATSPTEPTFRALDATSARRILGVDEGANFGEVQRQYERLTSRCNPSRFPNGSDEARQAANIRTQVAAAYRVLKEGADATDRRFGSLEIE